MTLDLKARVSQMRYESPTVLSLELVPAEPGERFPDYGPGAHIDLELGGTLRRSYSLHALPDGARYAIAVHRAPDSRGGSAFVHDRLRVGDLVAISRPKNNFRLDETAEHTVLIGGGIGVTPLLCMARRLTKIGASWTFHLAARNRSSAALLVDLTALHGAGGTVVAHFDDEAGGFLDLAQVVKSAPADSHFYCCGPMPMMNAFKAATSKVNSRFVHVEYFSAQDQVAREGGFEVVLARQGRSLFIPPGKTILEILVHEKVNVPFACSNGVCGTCETHVLEGTPDHRDSFLTDDEKAGNASMMVCCSGSRTARLVLDL